MAHRLLATILVASSTGLTLYFPTLILFTYLLLYCDSPNSTGLVVTYCFMPQAPVLSAFSLFIGDINLIITYFPSIEPMQPKRTGDRLLTFHTLAVFEAIQGPDAPSLCGADGDTESFSDSHLRQHPLLHHASLGLEIMALDCIYCPASCV